MSSVEERLAAIEAELAILRQEAAAARALAAGADRDVADYRSEMRGQTRVLSALRETQAEQGQQMALATDLQALRTEMTARFDQVNGGITKIVQLLERLEN